MKKSKLLFILLVSTLTSISIISSISMANDAPINLQSGSAQPLTGPLSVSMNSEVVKITLGRKSYTVDATFNFSNSGKTVKLSVGFPKNGIGWLDDRFSGTSDFIKFETWVDGKQVKFSEKPNIASIEGSYTLPDLIKHIKNTAKTNELNLAGKDYRWLVKEDVQFPSNQAITTRVRYEAPYQNVGSECFGAATYIYGTGTHWNGNIGESRFIVDATGLLIEDRPTHMGFVDEKDDSKIKCSNISAGIFECVIKDYKPATPEAGVVIGVGCIDYQKARK